MKKEYKIAIVTTGAILLGYFIYRKFLQKTKKEKPFSANPTSNVTFVPPPQSLADQSISRICKFPIKKNVYDCYFVKSLQFALNRIPKARSAGKIGCENKCYLKPLVEDGDWGNKTQALLEDTFGSDAFPNGITAQDLQDIYSYVITDPVAYQEAENPNILAPTPPPPTRIDWSSGIPVVTN